MKPLQQALSDLLAAIPNGPERPIDLQRQLGLDSKLCWQVFNIVRADDVVPAAQHVPRAAPLKRLLKAAEAKGVATKLTAKVRTAAERFDTVVAQHGPNRTSFDSTLAACFADGDDGAALNLFHRRAAFRSQSHLWGVQVGTFLTSTLFAPSKNATLRDECTIAFRMRQRRLRPDAQILVHGYATVSKGKLADHAVQRPLDRAAAEALGAPLLPQFCSNPLPRLRTVDLPTGWTQVELDGNEVGEQSSVDFAFGLITRERQNFDEASGAYAQRNTLFRTPAELYVSDCLVHRGLGWEVRPQAYTFERPDAEQKWETAKDMRQLPMFSKFELLGKAARFAPLDAVPRYVDALQHACDALGWNLNDFDLYRLALPYPIQNSIVRNCLLPARAG